MARSLALLILSAVFLPAVLLATEPERRWQAGGPEGGWVSDIAFSASGPSTV